MFGQELIVGHYCAKIDATNRLSVPVFTHREPGDKIFTQTYKYKDGFALKLYSYYEYRAIITKLEQLKENASSLDEFYKIRKELENLYNQFSSFLIVSDQNRLTIPKTLMETLQWESNQYYRCDGLGNSLLVRKK